MKFKSIIIGFAIGFFFVYLLMIFVGLFLSFVEWDITYITFSMSKVLIDSSTARLTIFFGLIGAIIGGFTSK